MYCSSGLAAVYISALEGFLVFQLTVIIVRDFVRCKTHVTFPGCDFKGGVGPWWWCLVLSTFEAREDHGESGVLGTAYLLL